jgi:V8-like Glu-specific endopeptidase
MIPRTAKFASHLLLLACTMILVGLTAQAQKGNSSSFNSAQRALVAAPRAWTREEMLAAQPYDLPAVQNSGAYYPSSNAPAGPPASEPGGRPGVSSSSVTAEQAVEEALFGIEPMANPAFTYPFPFSRYEHLSTRYADYPYGTVGKVFFTKFGGGNYVCSASSIGNYAVITAGHCVSDGLGHYHTNWVFVPRYLNGAAPLGQWTANHLWVRTAWHNGGGGNNVGDFAEDIGGAVLNKLGGFKLSQKVGFLGWAVNQPNEQVYTAIGYPQAAPFNGSRMIICQTAFAKTDFVSGVLKTFGVGCDMTGGSSGGPIIRKFSHAAGANFVNGVNSYKYTNPAQPLAMYSPYFGANAQSMINCLKNSGPGNAKCTAPPAP